MSRLRRCDPASGARRYHGAVHGSMIFPVSSDRVTGGIEVRMRDGPLRRRCQALVDSLKITVAFDTAAFCGSVAADRRRPIRRLPRELPGDGLFGMWAWLKRRPP